MLVGAARTAGAMVVQTSPHQARTRLSACGVLFVGSCRQVLVAPGACRRLASSTTKRHPVGRAAVAALGILGRSRACTHGPQARKRAAPVWSVMDVERAVKVPATAHQDWSNP